MAAACYGCRRGRKLASLARGPEAADIIVMSGVEVVALAGATGAMAGMLLKITARLVGNALARWILGVSRRTKPAPRA